MRPDLFGAVVLRNAFLDLCSIMSDPHLPLTVHEYEEWGNPEDPQVGWVGLGNFRLRCP